MSEPSSSTAAAPSLRLSVTDPWQAQAIADHGDFLVAYKPPGMSFHREGDAPGLLDILRQAGHRDLHAVHRLDRITSGLVLVARGAEAARELGEAFEARRVTKCYLALSDRKPSKKQGLISGGMAPGRNGTWRLTRELTLRAVTRFQSVALEEGLRLFVLYPQTGRTHQLRVAMKSISAPILGDTRYGGSASDRGYLHAYALRFDWRGQPVSLVMAPNAGLSFQLPGIAAHLAQLTAAGGTGLPAASP
ncbi:RNA pseudouridine synthase [Chitiniphilus shinanonensis]|uniref:RNA pseudouridine synthase n=1 Tax=Chitiniphilus shinanonensis TaxID=553088 RepID=A0ABQ6BRD9_9NEIS|nr:TIGR01621 family pseudouridine synthase [Chitiniphilus shinanonensis]GLS04039.1 RNA pseudouridine synthase [Chitiniphilus shinanonensis]